MGPRAGHGQERVADALRRRLPSPIGRGAGGEGDEIEVDTLAVGGLRLMERLAGYDRAILVDAICTGEHAPGTLLHLGPDDAPTQHTASSHDVNLPTALKLARALAIKMPEDIRIIAVEAENVLEFNDHCCPAVEAALPEAVEAVLIELTLSLVGKGERRRE